MSDQVNFAGAVDPDCRIMAVGRKCGISPTVVANGFANIMYPTIKTGTVKVLNIKQVFSPGAVNSKRGTLVNINAGIGAGPRDSRSRVDRFLCPPNARG